MLRGQNIFLPGNGNMCINLCDMDGAVSKHFLNKSYVYIGFQKACCKRMAKHMGRNMHFYGSEGGIFVYHPPYGLIR